MVDDSHAVGFMGATGAGTPEHFGVSDRVDLYTGTFGKALGGASGGYVSGRREIVAMLRQKGRPYLFSNSLAPSITAATLTALELVEGSAELRASLFRNAEQFRRRMGEEGFELLDGEHAIFGVTQNAFLVFTANVFALMGLRQLYFLLGGLVDKLVYLHYGIAAILGFIGIKLIIHALHSSDWEFLAWGHSIPEVPTWLSLTVIVLAMAVATIASLMKMKKDGISFKDVSADQSDESEEA